MRYCRNCKRLSLGRPSFCTSCGRSFDLKRCPAGHLNPRGTVHCGRCGSTDLSLPHPRRSLGAVALRVVLLLVLTVLSAGFILTFVQVLLSEPSGLLGLMLLGLVLSLFWLLSILWDSA